MEELLGFIQDTTDNDGAGGAVTTPTTPPLSYAAVVSRGLPTSDSHGVGIDGDGHAPGPGSQPEPA